MKSFVKEWTLDSVDFYLNEIGNYPLLDASKETKLAIQYEKGRAAQKQLESSDLDARRRIECRRLVESGRRARQRLIQCNLRLVISLIKPYRNCGLPFGDLVQEGNLGLMHAVERFDHRRGVRFASYAGWWIRHTVMRALASQGRPIRVPPAVNDELSRLQKITIQLEARLHREPTIEELAVAMGSSRQRVRQLRNWDCQMVSLDTPVGENEDMALSDVIPDRKAPPMDEALALRQLQERLQAVMVTHLDSRDQMILSLRFGLGGDQRQTLQEIAGALGITQERARQVEKMALKRLRRSGALYELGHI